MNTDFDFTKKPDRYVAIGPVRRGGGKAWRFGGPFYIRLNIDGRDIQVATRASWREADQRAMPLIGRFGTVLALIIEW